MPKLPFLLLPLFFAAACSAEYHVSPLGNAAGDGSADRPFQTISAAAKVAQPGDVITVHAGTYRERVTPPRGGVSESRRIVYRAAPGEEVVIKGSEIVRGWKPFKPGVWKVTLPDSFFGDYNPYRDLIAGDWFRSYDRPHHTGEVYLNGKSLYEMSRLEEVLNPRPIKGAFDPEGSTYTWFCESDGENTHIYANFHDHDPNAELVEINVRPACFYPDRPGRDFITVRGFRMSQAATQWAAPTAEQIGLLGTHWSRGWIIEDNIISDSRCAGITLGKDRASGHNVWSEDPRRTGAEAYNEVIRRVLETGWSKENVGSHIVRNNVVFNCGQAGICGSLDAIFSRITNNHVYNIWTKRLFAGAEIAGIKIHAPIDTVIAGNHIHHAGRGIWMDWMMQGTRISGNLLHDNTLDDLCLEVNHGPYLVDNNILLSRIGILDESEGGAFVHNLVAGKVAAGPVLERRTPYLEAHSTAVVSLVNTRGGDDRFYNNIFVGAGAASRQVRVGANMAGYGLCVYDGAPLPLQTGGNVYLYGARPWKDEKGAAVLEDHDPGLKLVEDENGIRLTMSVPELPAADRFVPTSELLGRASVPDLPYENGDGTPLAIDRDYFGKPRNAKAPSPGPFENLRPGTVTIELEPRGR